MKELIKFIILFFAILSSIGVLLSKDDESSWDDKSIIFLSIVASIAWALYFTLYF